VKEVRGVFSSAAEIQPKAVAKKYPFLLIVLKEGFRVHPPAPFGMGCMVKDPAGASIDGGWASRVHIFQWASNMAESDWTRPQEFLPDWWLKDGIEADEFAKDAKESLHL